MVLVNVTRDRVTINENNFPPETTIRQIKERVERFAGIKVENQRLSRNGRELKNDHTLEFCGFRRGYVRLDLEIAAASSSSSVAATASSSSSCDPRISVVVKSSRRESVMMLRPVTPVSSLKTKIEREWGILYDRLTLLHNQKMMIDDLPLSHYNITEGSIIDVLIEYDPQ